MKKLLFLVLVLATLVLAGCEDGSQKQSEIITASFIGGTQALEISFVEGAPPDEILDANTFPFNVNLELKNVGESDVKANDMKIELSGINPTDFNKQSSDLVKNSLNMDLLAKRKTSEGEILDGGQTYIDFAGLKYMDELPEGGNFPVTLDARLCYKYANRAISKMCVRKDLLRATANSEDGCEVRGDKSVFNSGGPVHITTLKQFPTASDKISFSFTVEKLGDGKIFASDDNAPNCEGDINTENKVFVTVKTGLGGSLTCDGFETASGQPTQTNEGYITLFSGKRMVTCVQTLMETLDFEKVVEFEMDYVYNHKVSKQITVKHPLN